MLGNPEIVKRIGDPAANQDFRIVSRIDATRVTLLPWLRVRPILETLVELHDRVGGALPVGPAGAAGAAGTNGSQREPTTLQLSRFDTPLIARLASAGVGAWKGAPQIRTLADRLAGFSRVAPVEPPRGLQADLRQYQREGLAWLQFLRSHGLSGLLADDMGLGKTVQTLAHILLEHEQGRLTEPALIVAPTSLVHNWVAEAQRFTPALRTLKLHGTQRHDTFDQLAHADLVVTSYALLPRDIEHLVKQPFSMVVLDEAQVVKNARTQAAQAVRLLRVGQRIALTGTPIENDLDELWAQFDFLAPGLLGDNRYFVKTWRTPIEKRGDTARAAGLAARVRPFMLRRTKEAVAPELPARTEIERAVELEGPQRDLYETVRAAMESRVRAALAAQGLAKSHIVVLDALLKLRQVCCDPRLVDLAAAKKIKQSAKFEALFDLLGTLRAEGRHILLFSQFTSMLALIEERLDREKTPYALLTGQTRDRARQVERFQKGEVDLFLLSLKAGGTGLNLTAADTVIHYDPWWNPATEQQATDRAHGIGQDKPVFVYRLIAAGTVEERIRQMQARKAQLAQAMLDDADQALARALTDTDIAALFQPVAPDAE
jgi:SNF2 family DNA or RNA helicase